MAQNVGVAIYALFFADLLRLKEESVDFFTFRIYDCVMMLHSTLEIIHYWLYALCNIWIEPRHWNLIFFFHNFHFSPVIQLFLTNLFSLDNWWRSQSQRWKPSEGPISMLKEIEDFEIQIRFIVLFYIFSLISTCHYQ